MEKENYKGSKKIEITRLAQDKKDWRKAQINQVIDDYMY